MLAFVTTTLVYAAVGNIIDKDSLMLICSVIVSILMCLSIIFLYRKLQTKEQIFALNKKISMKSFFRILIVFMAVCTITSKFIFIIEDILSLFGSGFGKSLDRATGEWTRTSIMSIVYVGIIGPILEEIIFRGYILNSLKPYGKKFAIILSSILFGMYHLNIVQLLPTIVMGIVCAYVAIEYSIKISIVLHIVNNLILAMGIPALADLFPGNGPIIVYGILLIIICIMAIRIIISNKKNVKEYLIKEKTKKGLYRQVIISPLFIVFAIICVIFTFT
ncbi:hypothetical protein SAMN02745248_01844 [Hathewaya proteolytica DSM 3090]|uniref:CAAX prenyl protease 2/Lysostaphin resistance protein A-like domain-containing protein n=1 Tax=Hathewaya proteolytica DSM 3090 TaxID=1121331 RepID=A0A1M6PWZ9_9CLOT|nr:type II CAAX endopeptidase family protein [Hathewaya proteolytica]SHK12469.1 hypothetical protein SAMN02745248_01844 [Hathewaya proteolytica DSM 3090]